MVATSPAFNFDGMTMHLLALRAPLGVIFRLVAKPIAFLPPFCSKSKIALNPLGFFGGLDYMTKFACRYDVSVAVDETAEKAMKHGFSVRYLEGQSRSGRDYYLRQLEIKLDILGAKSIVSPTKIQVFWDDFDKLDEIESVLQEIIVPIEGSEANISEETRVHIPTMYQIQERLRRILEILKLEREFERKTGMKGNICSVEMAIMLFEAQEEILAFETERQIQSVKELVGKA